MRFLAQPQAISPTAKIAADISKIRVVFFIKNSLRFLPIIIAYRADFVNDFRRVNKTFEKVLDFSFFMDYNIIVINDWEDI